MYINFHLDKDDWSPVFAMSPRYLNIVVNTGFQNLT